MCLVRSDGLYRNNWNKYQQNQAPGVSGASVVVGEVVSGRPDLTPVSKKTRQHSLAKGAEAMDFLRLHQLVRFLNEAMSSFGRETAIVGCLVSQTPLIREEHCIFRLGMANLFVLPDEDRPQGPDCENKNGQIGRTDTKRQLVSRRVRRGPPIRSVDGGDV